MLQRYLVFVGWDYYPDGGWNDFVGSCSEMPAAEALLNSKLPTAEESYGGWGQIVDGYGPPYSIRWFTRDKGAWIEQTPEGG